MVKPIWKKRGYKQKAVIQKHYSGKISSLRVLRKHRKK